jgi:HlyD family secretion protein
MPRASGNMAVDPGLVGQSAESHDHADLLAVLEEEIARLPRRHRAVFILCCLEGRTGEEAARQLGCPPGTVSSRLTRARKRLRRRLTRRGFGPSAGVLAGVLAGETWAAPLASHLVGPTLGAARAWAEGQPPGGPLSRQAVALAKGELRAMCVSRLKVCALLLAGLLATGGVLLGHAAPEQRGAQNDRKVTDPPGPARVIRAEPDDRVQSTQSCSVVAVDRADLRAIVPGIVKSVTVDIGDRVKKGQVLAELHAPLLLLDVKQAQANVRQAEGQIREAQARLEAARAEVKAAKALLQQRQAEVQGAKAATQLHRNQLERMRRLFTNKAVDEQQVAEAQQKLQAAQSQLAAAEAAAENARADLIVRETGVARAEAALVTAKAGYEGAEVALEKAKVLVEQTRILAPFDGVVIRRNVSSGHYLRPGERGGNEALLTIVRTDLLRVVVEVPEQTALRTTAGTPARVTFPALPGKTFKGKVTRTAFALDPSDFTMN